MSAKFSFQKGKPHVTLNIHPRIPMQKASALTKALAAVMAASFAFVVFAEKKRFSKARHSRNENKRYK